MLKIKCCKCGYSNVYETEKHAYMDGWYYRDGRQYPNTRNPIEICERCQNKEKENTIVDIAQFNDNQD
jgi:hypothetical protein